ncbi:amidohydrolase family protein [Enterocloster lavalensis]|uniref:amidohydrolase family protein n=1 Tax=Enterocloster lavalensis TaxID=460384 RepID=UPI003983E0D2
MIIDFHAHVERDPITKVYDIEGILKDMDENSIDLWMISTLEGKCIKDQNDAIAGFVRQYPNRLLGCAVINPKEDDCVEEAERVAQMPEIRALEFNSWEHGFLPEKYEYHLDPIFDIAAKYGLVVKLFAGWGPRTMPQQWEKYIKRHPDVTFVVLHIGGIDFGYGSIPFVGSYDNLLFETSEQTEMQVLHEAFRQLPMEKFLFGSNYPTQATRWSVDTFDLLHFSEEEREKMFCQNAKKLLNLQDRMV